MTKNYKKHNSVSIKQWPNNYYTFNRNNNKLSIIRRKNLSKLINSYFNFSHKERTFKSRRMRNLIKRSSTTRIFGSNTEIKQNNDNINVTIYTYDRQKTQFLKNLYNLNRSLAKHIKYNAVTLNKLNNQVNNILLSNNNTNTNSKFNNIYMMLNELRKRTDKTRKLTGSSNLGKRNRNFIMTKKNNIYFSEIYSRNIRHYFNKELIIKNNKQLKNITPKKLSKMKRFFTRKMKNSIRKNTAINKFRLFKMKKRMLQSKKTLWYKKLIKALPWSFDRKKILLFNIMCNKLFYLSVLNSSGISYRLSSDKKMIHIIDIKSNYIINTYNLPIFMNKKNKIGEKIKYTKWQRIIYINQLLNILTIKLLIKINNSENLTHFELNNSIKESIKLKNKLYEEFKAKNIIILFNYYFAKQSKIISNIYQNYINNDKFVNFANNFKYIVNKVYNKDVILNLVDLKYIHLNTDNFTNAIAIKLVSKKNNLMRTIKRSLKLAKLNTKSNVNKNNKVKDISLNNLINDITLGQHKTNTLESKDKSYKNKTREILKGLQHKWTTGVRLEGKGRLTSRFAAARTLYKYKAKGSLRTKLEFSQEDRDKANRKGKDLKKETPSVMLFRGIYAPNLQYKKKSSFRRIGAFGLKLWMNYN